jgi:cell division septation protein DedD
MFLSGFALGLMANNNKNTGAGSAPSSPVVVAPSYNNASPAGPSYNNANPSYNNNNATSPSGANNNSQPNNAAPNSQPNNLASLPVAPVTTPRASSTTPGSAGSPSATTSYYLVPSGSSYIAVPANTASGVEAAKDSKGNTISINIDLGKGKGATPEATVTNTATPAPAAGTAIAPVAPPPAASAPEKLPPPSPVQTGMEPAPRKEAPVVVSGTPPSAAASMKIVPFMPPADNGRCYRVQVGAFTSMEGVNEAVERVQQAGYTAFYEKAGKFYRVVILHISASEMREVAKKLQSVGFSELWLRPEGV